MITQRRKFQFSGLLVLSAVSFDCGNKTPLQKIPRSKSNDSRPLTASAACVSALQCPQNFLSLSGITTLGGSAEALLTWDVGAVSPDDRAGRQVMVVMQTNLPGMQIISKPTDLRVSVNWKPMVPQNGVMEFRARDITRCQVVTANSVNCGDMSVPQPQFEQILPAPFQVVPKNETFDASSSEFFRKFHCSSQGLTTGERAILAGGSVIGGAVAGGIGGGASYLDISGIIDDNCTSCHSPEGKRTPYLTSYDEVKPYASSALARMKNQTMPPAPGIKVSQAEVQEFQEWVSNGMPQSTTANGATGALGGSSGITNGVATITDYLVNGNTVPTAYQCIKQNAASTVNTPTESSVFKP